MRRISLSLAGIVVLSLLQPLMGQFRAERESELGTLWTLQSSEKTGVSGEEISKPDFPIRGWIPAEVPSTVLGTLVEAGIHRDIFTGRNLEAVSKEPFQSSWWYRREFAVGGGPGAKRVFLEFDGINYRADIWLNGKLVAGKDEVFGPFRRFSFDVTEIARLEGMNILAVEVFPPQPGDFAIGFVDWNPPPPDRSMGLWRPVRVRTSGDVSLRFPVVRSRVNLETLDEARLTVQAELRNHGTAAIEGILEGRIENIRFSRKVRMEPGETRTVVFDPEEDPRLEIRRPRLWWTHDMGQPELYRMDLVFRTGNAISDAASLVFGIRDISSRLNANGHRIFELNGKPFFVRGAGWTDDMLLNVRRTKLESEILYVRHMNLNTIRLEGFWGTGRDLYALCDRAGIMIMAGWSCQWEWSGLLGKPTDRYGGIRTEEDMRLAVLSWRDQVRWLRNHPSILVWLMGSDLSPRPELERRYLEALDTDDPTRPRLLSASARESELSGKTGVKMNGPYDYVPPVYWHADTKHGGAFGFSTETGPGPQVPPLDSLKRMFFGEALWPVNETWIFHAAYGKFQNLDRYIEAMNRRLGPARDVRDFAVKAQFLNYEGVRAMFEAFTAGRPRATGLIHWMLNSAWPSLWWQLYDYYLMPTGAFYGARKANTPVHILYDYATREVKAVNTTREPVQGLQATATVYSKEMKRLHAFESPADLQAGEIRTLGHLPEPANVDGLYFADLRLLGRKNVLVSANFYCLSTVPDVLDEAGTTHLVTPMKGFSDMTALADLPPVRLKVRERFSTQAGVMKATVDLENPSPHLALHVELAVLREESEDPVLPILWEDNYLTLLPGEKRRVEGSFRIDDLRGERPRLQVGGWNIR